MLVIVAGLVIAESHV